MHRMQTRQTCLVYRDRLGIASEVGFLRRQYVGFKRLQPIWMGRSLLAGADMVGQPVLRLGGDGPLGPGRRLLFRHFGQVPDIGQDLIRVVHAQFARGGALALPLVRSLGVPLAITLHGGDVSKRKNWRGTVLAQRWPQVVKQAACFVCVSGAVAEIAAARGVPPAKLTVLPIGTEVPDRLPQRHPAAYLFVGRLVEKKGIVVLVEAVRRLRALGDQTPLVCVGDGPMRGLLEALARQVPDVTLTGWIDEDEVAALMGQAVCLIVPSVVAADGDAEGLPSVIAEAMAQGCPVVGSNQGGIAEAVRHGRTGLLVPAGDADALARAMHRMGTEAGLAAALGAAGYALAVAELNARLQSAKLEALLLSL